jgi:hypothetical protein
MAMRQIEDWEDCLFLIPYAITDGDSQRTSKNE